MPPPGIPIHDLAFRERFRTTPIGCWASDRCWRSSRRRILLRRRVPTTAAVVCAPRIGNCATSTRSILGASTAIPKRVFYIDSEGWFITASDQFDRNGQLWKTLVTFNAYRDRAVPGARVAIWPYKRMFQTALVDADLTDGFSTVVYSPGPGSQDDGMYINMGAIDQTFFTPERMVQAGH